ncbi:hypothetical protein, partial [Paenibacillus puerhi]|uniref:hypothetical protein n=1 Tax=Paenibacillus puerhi TaxID=2692622 RepID=UPI001F465F15
MSPLATFIGAGRVLPWYGLWTTMSVFCKRKMLKLAAKNAETACQMNGHCGIRSIACLSRKLSPVN